MGTQNQRCIPGSDVAAQPAALVKIVGKGLPTGKYILQCFFLCSKCFLSFCQLFCFPFLDIETILVHYRSSFVTASLIPFCRAFCVSDIALATAR